MKIILIVIAFIVLYSCKNESTHKFNEGKFPESPINLGLINSIYDDYNSDIPYFGEISPLCFSTNRNSNGSNFDLIYKLLEIKFNKTNGNLIVGENNEYNLDIYRNNFNINDALIKINTSFDEFGPHLINLGTENFETKNILLFSNNKDGNQNINFIHNLNSNQYSDPKQIKYLNSNFDDAYPSINSDLSEFIFCSNRNGNFDFFKVSINNIITFLDFLSDTSSKQVSMILDLNSENDDKCPYILNNFIVFSSNRPGGYGGFDLYYSYYINNKWQKPMNFGNKINTEYDEYRPIVKKSIEFSNDFMLFSSNRPNGKGGFDLYYTGIEKIK